MCASAEPLSTCSKQLPQLSHFAFCIKQVSTTEKTSRMLKNGHSKWTVSVLRTTSLPPFLIPTDSLTADPYSPFPLHTRPTWTQIWACLYVIHILIFSDWATSVVLQEWLSNTLSEPVFQLQEGCAGRYWMMGSKILAAGLSKPAFQHPSAHPIIQLHFQPSQRTVGLLESCPHL